MRSGVVYLYIPTSNHNGREIPRGEGKLYIFIFLHQTTTNSLSMSSQVELYIFIFLHQTTTQSAYYQANMRCISLYSYIKPQLVVEGEHFPIVVYLYIPTSNHN